LTASEIWFGKVGYQIENELNYLAERLEVNDIKSNLWTVITSLPQGSVLRSILFNVFNKGPDGEAECTLNKFWG